MAIDHLIDKTDNIELIRDQVAAILALETANQQYLAAAAGKDPQNWRLLIYSERVNRWAEPSRHPVINVWYDQTQFNGGTFELQRGVGLINIDCYGYGVAGSDPIAGQVFADETAARAAQSAGRLVRNILMATEYLYLGMRGIVGRQRIKSAEMLYPDTPQNTFNVCAQRIVLQVDYNETSPQYTPVNLEYISIDVKRAEDGLIIVEADYDNI